MVSENPLDIVPSIDEVGHGTMMAGIAAGTPNESFDFFGVAPDAELVIIEIEAGQGIFKGILFNSSECSMLSRKLYYVGHRILCLGWEILKSTSGNLSRTWDFPGRT